MKDSPLRASNMQRAWLCPPAPWREMNMPDEESEAAAEGTEIHNAITCYLKGRGYRFREDNPNFAIFRSCADFAESMKNDGYIFVGLEYPLRSFKTKHKLISRDISPDAVIVGENVIRIIEFKTGRLVMEYDAQFDLQMFCYAFAVRWHYFGLNHFEVPVECYRFHPRLPEHERVKSITYQGSAEYWEKWELILRKIIEKSRPTAKAKPGETQCKYCKAKAICLEFQEWADPKPIVSETEIVVRDENLPISRDIVAKLLPYRSRLNMLDNMLKNVETMAKAILEQGGEIVSPDGTHWGLKNGNRVRSIRNTAEANARLSHCIPYGRFLSACKVNVGQLEEEFNTVAKSSYLQTTFQDVLGEIIEYHQNQPSLIRIKTIPVSHTQVVQNMIRDDEVY